MAFTETEARAQLPSLIDLALAGEKVEITADNGSRLSLVSTTEPSHDVDGDCPMCQDTAAADH